jgi:hypothetical protein
VARTTGMRPGSAPTALSERLSERLSEIEQAVITRIYAISDPTDTGDPLYLSGLRDAVRTALEYGLEAIERGDRSTQAPPAALLAQARAASRAGVGVETILRRYLAGYSLLGEQIIAEAERLALSGVELKRLLRSQGALLDRVLAAVGEEYGRESRERLEGSERHRAERVRRLLCDELLDAADLGYDFEGTHLGAIATGPGTAQALRQIAASLAWGSLLVRPANGTIWAWFGARRGLDPTKLYRHLSRSWPAEAVLSLGEPAEGLEGWRLTHRQAKAALVVALEGEESITRYAEVPLLACALQDDLLATSIYRLYLAPLERERDGGRAMRETLSAYLAAGRNVSSAAVALGASRRTVTTRLQAYEGLTGRSLVDSAAEVETALRLAQLNGGARSLWRAI